jgi:hypothetical protein
LVSAGVGQPSRGFFAGSLDTEEAYILRIHAGDNRDTGFRKRFNKKSIAQTRADSEGNGTEKTGSETSGPAAQTDSQRVASRGSQTTGSKAAQENPDEEDSPHTQTVFCEA